MASWSTEPAAPWMPCDLQLANNYWTMEPALCAPCQHTEYASTQLFDSCNQISVRIYEDGQQYCDYEVATQQYDRMETTRQQSAVVDVQAMERTMERYRQSPIHAFRELAENCNKIADMAKRKMHRYPASIRALSLDARYIEPTLVAIGPYYHGRENLKQAEKMKHVAAYQCIYMNTQYASPQEMYHAVVQEAHAARGLYDTKDMEAAGIGEDDFLHIMFFDACFLVQFMLLRSRDNVTVMMEESLLSFFEANHYEIFHDIMLLENQIPWSVVEKVMEYRPVSLMDDFIKYLSGCLQDLKSPKEKPLFIIDRSFKPSHLLSLLRHSTVGAINRTEPEPLKVEDRISLSVSANELAEVGIKLKGNKNIKLIHMGVEMRCIFGGELFLAPLSLDVGRASCLVSMAALELCTTPDFQDEGVGDEASAVCSYLLLLGMLVAREEDVQKLRTRHVLQGAGLADTEVLHFFNKLHGIRLGSCYVRTMKQIEKYKNKRRTRNKLYAFLYRNRKLLAIVVPIILTLIGIIISIFMPNGGS